MTPDGQEPRKSSTLATLEDLVRRTDAAPTPSEMSRGFTSLSGRLAVERAQRRVLLRICLAGMATAACAAGAFGLASLTRARRPQSAPLALAYRADGGKVIEGGYLRESGKGGITLTFSEGTKLSLSPGTHGRLRSVGSAGAHIAIENGTASCQVVPRNNARWLVEVGPFLVTVNGTVFTVSWDPESERFDLVLREGRVTVSGPVSGGALALQAGQRLAVDLMRAQTVITEDTPQEMSAGPGTADSTVPAGAVPGERPPADARKPARRSGSGAPAGSAEMKVAAQSRWAEAVAAADWDRILRETRASGVEWTLDRASSEDIAALADAARYRRRNALAREALLAQRRRFPDAARALDASYLLGRVEESTEHGSTEALRWYEEYLARSPTGTYASEALGRKMSLTVKLGTGAQVHRLAEEYLRRFPGGAYAGSARALLQGR
jgi:hypothetical protein